MTTTAASPSASLPRSGATAEDHRGFWLPTGGMIATRIMELRKRRGLMIALVLVNIGIPTIFLVIRLLAHAFDPKSYGPAGGYDIFSNLVAGVMFIFGFIVAATLGCTAGSIDLTEGMFRHLVVTGRSRLALYLARIPAGLAIVVPIVAVGFTIVCAVCVFAAPTKINYDGVNVPAGLTRAGFVSWAADHPGQALCGLPFQGNIQANIPCGPNGPQSLPTGVGAPSAAALRSSAIQVANQAYPGYRKLFLVPPDSLMIKAGLWIELEAAIGLIVGLGLASLLGGRTIAVILMLVLQLILTPILSTAHIPHLSNLQRSVVGLATAHLEPGGLPFPFGGGNNGPGGGGPHLLPESTTVAICVILAWVIGWTALGAWRMMTRDA